MDRPIFAFGEILWDCLPSGRHAGGAPFNVTAHLAQLGVPASLISAVGRDVLGDEILQVAHAKNVDTRFVARARIGLPTGTVVANVDAAGNATYDLVQPVAWDEITVTPAAQAAVAQAGALVFGSLSSRSPYNREQLDHLLALPGFLKFFDVNLRPPFVDPARVVGLAARADVIKLNEDELRTLASWLQAGDGRPLPADGPAAVADACGVLARATGNARICVTLGAAGAAFWERHAPFVQVPAPPAVVVDTVGAGDAFMAGLVAGLTHGVAPAAVLAAACRLGAYVASHAGATPLLPPAMIEEVAATLGLRMTNDE
jgi:fructokinase